MNPAVTLTFVVIGIIKPGLALLYTIAQCIGSTIGAAVIYVSTISAQQTLQSYTHRFNAGINWNLDIVMILIF